MPRYRLYNTMTMARALIPVLRTANTTVDGDIIDLAGSDSSITFAVYSGLVTDGTWTFSIRESDDGTTFTDAAATASEQGTVVFVSTDDDTVKEIGYKGRKRFCRVRVISTGASVGALLGAVAVRDGGRLPVTKSG